MAIDSNRSSNSFGRRTAGQTLPNGLAGIRARVQALSAMEAPANFAVLFHMSFSLAGFLIIFSRRPDAILNAQFWAEDGQRWYADAYHFGLRCLLIPDELGGYFHTASRLCGLIALVVPFSLAPLVMNLCAIVIQILPASFFLSSRFSNIGLAKQIIDGVRVFWSAQTATK